MFFTGRWNRWQFAISIALSVLGFIALTIGFQYALIASMSGNCSSVNGACGAVGLLFSAIFKPLIYTLFLVSLVPALMGRLRDIGVTPWLCLFVLLLVAADSAFLLYAGAPWSFAFSAGALRIQAPIFLLAALALMVVLAIIPSRVARVTLRALGWPGGLALAIAVLVAVAACYRLMWSAPNLLSLVLPVIRVVSPVLIAGTYALIALPPATAFALWPRPGQALAPLHSGPRMPLVRLAVAALALGAGTFLLTSPGGIEPLALLLMLPAAGMRFVLPNAVLYFLILLALYLWVKRPSWVAAVITALVLGVYATWGYQVYLAANSQEIDARDVAAIPVAKLAEKPRAIYLGYFFGGSSSDFLRLALERSDFDTIVFKQDDKLVGYRYIAADKLVADPKNGFVRDVERYPVDVLPDPHLELKTWSESQFYSRAYGGQYEGSSPYELHLVDGDSDQLIAVWYRRLIQAPFWLPILTDEGWFTNGGYRDRMEREDAGRQFLNAALGEVPLVPRPKLGGK